MLTRRIERRRAALLVVLLLLALGCKAAEGPQERFTVPAGAGVRAIADTLAEHEIIDWPGLFPLYVRLHGADDRLKAGTYELPRGAGWGRALDVLVAGRVVTLPVTIPEGWTAAQIAVGVAPIARLPADSARRRLLDPALADSLGAPGPTLEGYLFPDTYRFALGVPLAQIAAELFGHYLAAWTPGWRAALDSIGMSERELVTLASIVQAEARHVDEMPTIAAVYHNRLQRGMRLQADPTVQYALSSRKSRLLFSDIDSVADHPYNTYTHAGLPPGPIGSPGRAALHAALHPTDVPYLYFVARPDGRHEFARTLREHNRNIREIRRGAGSRGERSR